MNCTFCGRDECSCDLRWVQLGDDTHATIATTGAVMIKQCWGGVDVVVFLSADQFAHLAEAVPQRLAKGN